MSMTVLSRWYVCIVLALSLACAGNPTLAQNLMPPNPHLPAAVRAAMKQEEGTRTGQWKYRAHPVRDAGKQDVANNPAAGMTQVLVSGGKQMPCILMKFPDLANRYSATDFQDLLFTAAGVPTGSAHDYYTEVSYTQFSLAGQVDGWYTTNNPKAYYADRTRRYADCAYEAAQKADAAGFNWAPYDNDHDGYVDTLWVVHSGLGAEETGNTRTDIWSHSWDFASARKGVFTTSTPDPYHPGSNIKINDYIIQPETSYWAGGNGITQSIVGIGVFCHEFGHALGLPDLYDTTGTGEGLGNASLMAAGSWGGDGNDSRYPAHLDAWCKADLGWITPASVTTDMPAASLTDIETTTACYLVKPIGSTLNQYFLVENRQQHGYDRTLFATGLFIYHIDTDIIDAYSAANTVNSNSHPFGVALEEADATLDSYSAMHLFTGSNRGSAADAWPNGAKNAFTSSSTPSTKANAGTLQRCGISGISAKGDVMTMDITVVAGANTAPAAGNDSYSIQAGRALLVRAPGVLGNDTDADGNLLTAVQLTLPSHGTLSFSANGSFTYTPTSGFAGTDTFTYQASDGIALSAPATVTITVTNRKK